MTTLITLLVCEIYLNACEVANAMTWPNDKDRFVDLTMTMKLHSLTNVTKRCRLVLTADGTFVRRKNLSKLY